MILDPAQGRRIVKLLFVCIYYFAEKLEMLHVIDGESPGMLEAMDVFRRVWGPGGRRDLVDGLVRENPFGLTRSELAVISKWRECVYGRFTVHTEGASVYYLAGDYAIEVYGPIREADRFGGSPLSLVETLLVPFDGVVVYGGWVIDLTDAVGEYRHDPGRAAFLEARRVGHVVHTERQFIESAARIREVVDQAGLGEGAPESDAPPRAGVLAGLTWEERNQAIRDALGPDARKRLRSVLRERIAESAIRGRPTTSLTEVMGRLKKDELYYIGDLLGAHYTKSMKKATLVELALDAVPTDGEVLWSHLVLMGPSRVAGMHALIEANGRIDLSEDDVDGLRRLPLDAFPLVALFRSGGVCSIVVPDEIMRALSAVPYGRIERRAEGFDRACRYALLSAEFRGVVSLEELTQECVELLGVDEDPMEIALAIAARIDVDDLPMDVVDVDGDPFVVSGGLVYYEHPHVLGGWETTFVHDLLDRHEEVAPRPLARLVREHDYRDWMDYLCDQHATRELVRYLDAHVPTHQDDIGFAEQLVEDLCMFLAMNDPDGYDRQRVLMLFEEFELPVGEEDMALVEGLIDAFVELVPNWYANGWPIMGRRLQLV